jgi:hypothetical protein
VGSGSVASGAGNVAEQKLALAHRALLQTRGLQFDFHTLKRPEPPDWLTALLRGLAEFAPVFKYVFWGGLAVGVALIVWLFVRELLASRFGRRKAAAPAADWRPEPGQARALLEDADRLAADGRFDEAVHLLLFRSIDDITGRRPGLVRPALTSRDIASLDSMPAPARSAFGRIAEAVERSFFGGRTVGADEFALCRREYEAFAFSEGWA